MSQKAIIKDGRANLNCPHCGNHIKIDRKNIREDDGPADSYYLKGRIASSDHKKIITAYLNLNPTKQHKTKEIIDYFEQIGDKLHKRQNLSRPHGELVWNGVLLKNDKIGIHRNYSLNISKANILLNGGVF